MVVRNWLKAGREKDVITLLENLFGQLPKPNARAEETADTLLVCYLEANAPRKKQKFIGALRWVAGLKPAQPKTGKEDRANAIRTRWAIILSRSGLNPAPTHLFAD